MSATGSPFPNSQFNRFNT